MLCVCVCVCVHLRLMDNILFHPQQKKTCGVPASALLPERKEKQPAPEMRGYVLIPPYKWHLLSECELSCILALHASQEGKKRAAAWDERVCPQATIQVLHVRLLSEYELSHILALHASRKEREMASPLRWVGMSSGHHILSNRNLETVIIIISRDYSLRGQITPVHLMGLAMWRESLSVWELVAFIWRLFPPSYRSIWDLHFIPYSLSYLPAILHVYNIMYR